MSSSQDTNTKKIVHYVGEVYMPVGIGGPAFVQTVDHPNSRNTNDSVAKTSKVVKIDEATGVFETQNTIYKPYQLILG